MMSTNINSITNLDFYGVDYRYIFVGVTKGEAINLLKKHNLSEKKCIVMKCKKLFIMFIVYGQKNVKFLVTLRLKSMNSMTIRILNVVDINRIKISNKISFDEENYKYFIGYKYDDYKIRPFYVSFQAIYGSRKDFDEAAYVFF